ncbi:hypothetical protein EDD21DRAFT_176061 [Dissophora ornata]|nr:hypothetical protein EDD21DRAFT_176061 [Dissophora ornata]
MDGDDASAFQKRDKIPQSRGESRIPVSRSRRGTTESVHRPKPAQNKAAATGASAPWPIPKSNNKKIPQSGGLSSSYTFDDTVENPFLSSTPPAFTPSMERTALSKKSSKENISSPPAFSPSMERTAFSKQPPSKENISPPPVESTAKFPTTTRTAVTHNTPLPAPEKPFAIATRPRDASVSSLPGLSGLPGPRHEDMILPAVAKRIKEQGLQELGVIAYSDDYDAPLYKLPSTPATQGNPFGTYDGAKAASSTTLGGQQVSPPGPSSSTNGEKEGGSQSDALDLPSLPPNPPVPESYEVLSPSQRRARAEAKADQEAPETKSESRSRRQQRSEDKRGTAAEATAVPTPASPANNSPDVTRPERPRRTRRNTDHQAQQEATAPNSEDYAQPQQTNHQQRRRRPTMPSSDQQNQDAGRSYQDQYGSNQGRNRNEAYANEVYPQQQEQQQQQQRFRNDSRDPYYQSNEIRGQESPKYGNERHREPRQDQYQGNGDNNRPRRQEGFDYQQTAYNGHQGGYNSQEIAYDSRDGNYNAQGGGYDGRQDRHDAYPQQGAYNGQQGGYNGQQGGYNGQQGGYNGQQGGYNGQQGGYNGQQGDNNNYGRGSSAQDQYQNNAQQTQQRPEMVQVEMSEMNNGPKGGVGESVTRIDPKDDKIDKKGSVCCVVM